MKTSKQNFIFLVISILFFSCEKTLDIKLPESEKQIVVDGQIVDRKGESFVKLSITNSFFSTDENQALSGASVKVSDNLGNTFQFFEAQPGLYLPDENFEAKAGLQYQLKAIANGKIISATSTMLDSLDNLTFRYLRVKPNNPLLKEGFYVYAKISDQIGVDNFFRAEFLLNGNRINTGAKDMILYKDRFFKDLKNVEGLLKFWDKNDRIKIKSGDQLVIKVYNMSGKTFDYYQALQDIPNQGGVFGKNPSNIPSNISGGLGLFQASSLKKAVLNIKD